MTKTQQETARKLRQPIDRTSSLDTLGLVLYDVQDLFLAMDAELTALRNRETDNGR